MPGGVLIRILRRRGAIGRAGHLLAIAALALNAFVVAPHVHLVSPAIAAPGEPDSAPPAPKHDCPIWMAHGTAGAALPAPFVAVPPPPFACGASVRLVAADISGSRGPAPFAARAPPESTV
ncbi:MAG TPA: hypothetical protein VGB90_07540 [Alphaproteobacteria bacterium]